MSKPASFRRIRPCPRKFARLSAYLDRELPPSACAEIRTHMAGCEDCRIVLKTLRKTIILCRRQPGRRLSRTGMNRVAAALKRRLARFSAG